MVRSAKAIWFFLVLVTAAPSSADQTWGGAVYIEGNVRVHRSAEPALRDLTKRDRLYPDDIVDADEGARIVLMLFGKSRFDVEGPALVRIVAQGVEVSSGKVWAMVSEGLLKAGESYEFRAPDAIARFRDTASMEVGQETTAVCAERGAVLVALTNGATIGLDPGECLRIGRGAQTVERVPLTPPVGVPKTLPKRHP